MFYVKSYFTFISSPLVIWSKCFSCGIPTNKLKRPQNLPRQWLDVRIIKKGKSMLQKFHIKNHIFSQFLNIFKFTEMMDWFSPFQLHSGQLKFCIWFVCSFTWTLYLDKVLLWIVALSISMFLLALLSKLLFSWVILVLGEDCKKMGCCLHLKQNCFEILNWNSKYIEIMKVCILLNLFQNLDMY